MAAVTICSDFEAHKIKSDTVSTVSPSISHKVIGPDAMINIIVYQLQLNQTVAFFYLILKSLPKWKLKFNNSANM